MNGRTRFSSPVSTFTSLFPEVSIRDNWSLGQQVRHASAFISRTQKRYFIGDPAVELPSRTATIFIFWTWTEKDHGWTVDIGQPPGRV